MLLLFEYTVPDSPTNIKTTEIGHTTITVQWDIPWILNGVLKTFIINVEEISSLDVNSCCASIAPIEIPIEEELPTYNYTVIILLLLFYLTSYCPITRTSTRRDYISI